MQELTKYVEAGLKERATFVEQNVPGCLRWSMYWNEELGIFHVAEMCAHARTKLYEQLEQRMLTLAHQVHGSQRVSRL